MPEPNWCGDSCAIGRHAEHAAMSLAALAGDYEDVAITYQVESADLYNHIIQEHYKPNEADLNQIAEDAEADKALLDELEKIEDESELLGSINKHVIKIMAGKLRTGSLRDACEFMDQLRKNIITRQKLRTEGSGTTTVNIQNNTITVVQGQLDALWKVIGSLPQDVQNLILKGLDDDSEQLVLPERTAEIMNYKALDDISYVTELQKESGKELGQSDPQSAGEET